MPVFRLPAEHVFPDPDHADPSGLLAVGGDLAPLRILVAYSLGIFPWFSEDDPILWWSPDPRLVLDFAHLKVSRSLRKTIRSGRYRVTADQDFATVIRRCGQKPRPGQDGTWITADIVDSYTELHRMGFAHSIEAWEGDTLAGGLYGLSLGGVFFGESMFADRPDASKVAFVRLNEVIDSWGFDFVDCQVETEHLQRFGAYTVSRTAFRSRLAQSLGKPTRRGLWSLGDE